MSGILLGCWIIQEPFVTGAAMLTWSISWNANIPSSGSSLHPAKNITGLSDVNILGRTDIALEKPGPPVTRATAGSPVTRAQPSAIAIAAPSCRVSMN